ncbi:MAG: hypothetical protein ACRDRF_00620, partial [Pseudonocardiaceae bacterium]
GFAKGDALEAAHSKANEAEQEILGCVSAILTDDAELRGKLIDWARNNDVDLYEKLVTWVYASMDWKNASDAYGEALRS